RWEPAARHREEFVDDELVCGSKGLPHKIMGATGNYQLDGLARYNAGFRAGFLAEEYRFGLPDAWQQSQASIQSKVQSPCAAEVPGDTQRFLNVATLFSQET